MSFWTYMLRCADGTYYVGETADLDARVWHHQEGVVRGYTYSRRPVELVWSEAFEERAQAREAERVLKGWSRTKKEAFLAGNTERFKFFSRKPAERKLFAERQRGAPSSASENVVGENLANARRSTSLTLGEEQSAATTSPQPAIVLVRPQLAENIGKAARAMLNFGLTDLRLVSPRDGWPNPDAGPAASGADSVIRDARLYETVADAVADCAHVYATTVRKRGVTKPVVDPAEAALLVRAAPERSAILFGPERAGLETDDVALARTILTVPINPQFGSLNLAQAVILVAYEWSKGASLSQPPKVATEPPAPQDELEGLVLQIDAALDHAGFYFPPDKVPTTKRMVRSLLTKPGWSTYEVRTLRGMIGALVTPRPKG
ncbi:TrmH family RNA methyltransferase [Sphingomonas sp. SUN039]|uniref:TrmH family RNA methyltransferase n=1 Tax=Sphingomonas sp. SUN039 TaxID=2937787 RepID=UPI00216435C4|nr:TrmH family RNA methyltransferase [Sphingomonas sp. SUN039]UVO52999.1 GIY-YIG nuclease family protein [Sphingomonas sp. SUN039]